MLKLRDSFTTETRLRVTLDEAIEIHAKALKFRYGRTAPHRARARADNCSAAGDRVMSSGRCDRGEPARGLPSGRFRAAEHENYSGNVRVRAKPTARSLNHKVAVWNAHQNLVRGIPPTAPFGRRCRFSTDA
jgi:hypothetical protein